MTHRRITGKLVIATHNADLAGRMDRVVTLKNGQVATNA